MLIRFEVSNFRSILDPVELSMVAIDNDRPEARPMPNIGESLLSVAAIYGPNASGKSNVLAGLSWLRSAIVESLRFWDDEIPVEPFAFVDGHNRLSTFTVEQMVAGVRFEYVLELDSKAVRYEALFHYPEKKRRRIFERNGNDLKLQRGLGHLSGTRELLTERALVLSIARRFDEPLVSDFAYQLISAQILGLKLAGKRRLTPHTSPTILWFEDRDRNQPPLPGMEELQGSPTRDRHQALALLRLADMGIDDVVVDDYEVQFAGDSRTRTQRRIQLVHTTGNESVPLDFTLESEGTRTWFNLIGPTLSALRSGAFLLFDELDASLHPTLSAELLRLFQDPVTNPAGAQLIFTSHDTSLLNHLNRDEVWLTEKAPNGRTVLGALADFAGERVRRSQNLEKAYLHGRFGALPDADRLGMLRALGLIG